MKYVTRAATMADVPRLREVEMRTLPHFTWYTTECAPLFIEQKGQRGEMVVAERPDLPADDPERIIGIGQYSIIPDGSGWMECLRILPEFQRTGAGRQIYERYQELWNETDAPHVAMFTDLEGFASKSLAELYGFKLAGTYDEYKLLLEDTEAEEPEGFERVTDFETVRKTLESGEGVNDRIILNRTYLHYNGPVYRWLIEKGMVWSDGSSFLVTGARMLEERGWFLPFWSGDPDKCLAFAIARAKKAGLPALTVSFPPGREDLKEYFESKGFRFVFTSIVMELDRRQGKG